MQFNRCFGCMKEINSYPCPHCGFDPGKATASNYVLPYGYFLNGHYVVGKVLGQGGFGITYIGFDLNLGLKVAIKEYFPSGQVSRFAAMGPALQWRDGEQAEQLRVAGMESFLREARKMAKVDDIPEIVRVRESFLENNTAYIVMDYKEGRTLLSLLKEKGPMPWEQAKDIFLPAISAMEKVHRAGIVHRDLSPDNLMLTAKGVRILDLGAAKDLSSGSGASSAQVAKGGFSPIEQYTQRGGSGPWSDVYAMAATIYYTLTGVLPPNAIDRMEQDTINWKLLSQRNVPANVISALQKAMNVTVKGRTQSMTVLLQQISVEKKSGLFGSRGKNDKKKEKTPLARNDVRKPEPPEAPRPIKEATPKPEKAMASEPEKKERPKPPKIKEPKPKKEPKSKPKQPAASETAKDSEKGNRKKRLPAALLIAAVLALAVGAVLLPGKPGSEKTAQMNAPMETTVPSEPTVPETTVPSEPTVPETTAPSEPTVPEATVPPETQPVPVHVMAAAEDVWLFTRHDRKYRPFWGQTAYRRSDVKTVTFRGSLENAPADAWDVSEAGDRSILAWMEGGDLFVAADGKIAPNSNASWMFASFENVTAIDFGGCFDTANVTNMHAMFWYCTSLTRLDVSGFDTSNVTDMGSMFNYCGNLTGLDVSGFDTSKVTGMSAMFLNCRSLTELDVSGFDTANVTEMGTMFHSCRSLTELDVSGFDTAQVTNMQNMFSYCERLKSLDLSNWNTDRVGDMAWMFQGCSQLTDINCSDSRILLQYNNYRQ